MQFDNWHLSPTNIPLLRNQIRPLIGSAADAIGLQQVLIARDALEQLPRLLGQLSGSAPPRALLVMDDVAMSRGGVDLKPLVMAILRSGGVDVEPLVLRGHGGKLHADEQTVAAVRDALAPSVAAVALGSGTICDITKHGSFSWQQQHGAAAAGPLVVVPTAASVAAYGINLAVILADGVKRTWPSRWPTAVVADLPTLQSAPRALTAAGFGDIVPRYVAVADWWLSDSLGMSEGFPPALVTAMSDCDTLLQQGATAVGNGSEEGVAALMGAIVLVGALVGPTGQSTILSGWEHVVSHVLDMTAAAQGRQPSLHGAQVGMLSLLSAIAYRRLFSELDGRTVDLDRCYPAPEAARRQIDAAFGPVDPSGRMAAECWRDYALKLERWQASREQFASWLHQWPEGTAAQTLRRYVASPETVARSLRAAGAPLLPEALDPPINAAQLAFALRHGHLIRRRFTVGDLLAFLGWLDDAFVDSIMDEARQLALDPAAH